MTNEEILKKAIEKAIKNKGLRMTIGEWVGFYIPYKTNTPETIIFSHDFAEAFWGDKGVCNQCGFLDCECKFEDVTDKTYELPRWKYCLMEMVLEKEPLKYLEKFL